MTSAEKEQALSLMKRNISRELNESEYMLPHAYFRTTVDATNMIRFRQKNSDPKPSCDDIIIKVVAKSLREYPQINSSLTGKKIVIHQKVNIGLTLSLEEGTVVAVVRDADQLSIEIISQRTKELIKNAKINRLTSEDIAGATFTISNLSMFQIDEYFPVINPPESGTLGIGRIQEKVTVKHGGINIRPEMPLTMSVDNRFVDEAIAAQFLQCIKESLESLPNIR